MRLHDPFEYWARAQPCAEFGVSGLGALSYGDASRLVNRIANALRTTCRSGKEPRAAVISKNSLFYALLYLASSKSGVVLVPINWRLSREEWLAILRDADPSVVIADRAHVGAVDEIRGSLDGVDKFIGEAVVDRPGWINLEEWYGVGAEQFVGSGSDAAAPVYQMYTSGTTGQPKGVVVSQGAVTANVIQISLEHTARPRSRGLVVLPMFHAAIIPSTLAVIAFGGSLYVMDGFEPKAVLRAFDGEGIELAVLVPAMLRSCVEVAMTARSARIERLRSIYYGASPIAESTLSEAMEVFDCGFVQSYGLTEASQAVTLLTSDDHRRALSERPELLRSAGRPVAGTQIEVRDPVDGSLSTNPGQIAVRGPQLMTRYWQKPEDTSRTLRDGWIHTGDIGFQNDEGYLFVVDRLNEMIISGGENVYPGSVERVLAEHPGIAESAVIGTPDDVWGETVTAFIVESVGERYTDEEILTFCRRKLAGFECPRKLFRVDSLPRSSTGKILRRELREPFWAGRTRRVSGA